MSNWTFFSNYGHVLVCLARDNEVRLRDVAQETGITERAVQKIVRDMQDAGFITISKQGRCNRYRINKRKSLRHGLESHCNVGKLLALITRPGPVMLAAEKQDKAEAGTYAPTGHAAKHTGQKTAKSEPVRKSEPKAAKATSDQSSTSFASRQQGSLF